MPTDHRRWLEEAAHAIADGKALDWDNLHAQPGDDDRATIDDLRLVANLAEVHRSPIGPDQLTGEATPAASPSSDQQTWGPLVLLERVGGGAYGDVYRARDPRLDREVALKLLRRDPHRESADDVVVHEARVLAKVRHPHVVTVYGADRFDGRVGLWMEFIRGRSLEQELSERGPFSAQEAALVAIELCGALGAVHRAGLVHRDVKAGNVMRDEDGRLVLMDFGTGCDQPNSQSPPVPAIVGTPLYVAPEVLAGQPAGPSSDLYALGVLLYHLVTGHYPVVGTTLDEMRQAHQAGKPRLLREARQDLPQAFVSAVDRALAPNPRDRFHAAADMEAALGAVLESLQPARPRSGKDVASPGARALGVVPRTPGSRVLAAAASLLLIVAASGAYSVWSDGAAAGRALGFNEHDWVLVSGFDNRAKDPRLDGLVEHAIGRELSRSQFFRLVSTERVGDALQLMGRMRTMPIDENLGREVCLRDGGIRALIAGSIEKHGTATRITARLVQPSSARTIWTASADAPDARHLLATATDLAVRIRVALGERRRDIQETPRPLEKATASLKALQLYSQGLALLDLDSGEHWAIPHAFLDQAINEDPGFAIAYAYRSYMHNTRVPGGEALRLADSERAFQLADRAGERERLFIRGTYFIQRRQNDKAAAEYAALVKLSPDHYWAVNNLAFAYDRMGAKDKALPFFLRRAELRPNSFTANRDALDKLLQAGQTSDAARYAEPVKMLAAQLPAGQPARDALATVELLPVFAAWHARDLTKAVNELNRLKARIDNHPARWELVDLMLQWYVALGRLHDADALALEQEDARQRATPTPSLDFDRAELTQAWNAYFRKDREGARRHLERLYSQFPPVEQNWRAMILMARVGMAKQAKTILAAALDALRLAGPDSAAATLPYFAAAFVPYYQGEIALGEGRIAEAVKILTPVRVGVPVMRQQALAVACEEGGDLQGALAAIERFNPMSVHKPIWLPTFAGPWYEMRASQARILRKLGRAQEAEAIEAELRTLLAAADSDHAVRAEMMALPTAIAAGHERDAAPPRAGARGSPGGPSR